MSPPAAPGQSAAPYRPSLHVGAAAPRPQGAILLLGGIGTVILGVAVAYLLATVQIRAVVLLLLTVMGLLCLRPKRGVYVLLMFLPFMYYLRRQVLHFNEFSGRDPILVFPPAIAVAMMMGIALFHGSTVVRNIRGSALMKVFIWLLALYTAQIFNPLQGSILVGLAGAMFFITPMLWLFFGLLMEERDIGRILGITVVLGLIVALYGLYQYQFGFSDVEKYEMESKEFYKAFGEKVRPMSTLAGLGDFSNYVCTTGFLAFAFYWRTKANLSYAAILGVCSLAMLWAATRTQFVVLAFSILMFLVIQPARKTRFVSRGVLVVILVGCLYGYLYAKSDMEIYKAHGTGNPFVAHVVGGLAHPTDETTFQIRLRIWSYVVGKGILEQPLGRGLGSTTTAAKKFAKGQFEAESYFFNIIYGSSLVAGILFILFMVTFYRTVLPLMSLPGDTFLFKVVTALISAYFLGSIFGGNINDSVNGPLAWLLIGWCVKEFVGRIRSDSPLVPA